MDDIAVFVVDDEPKVLSAVRKTLERSGMRVKCFTCADNCLAQLSKEKCDLLITDVRMPGKDGIELLCEVRARLPLLPVVVVTGYGDASMALRAMKAGAAGFLEKPLDRDKFVSEIRAALHRRPSQFGPTSNGAAHTEGVTSARGRLSTAIAEIVGGFCHDLGNALSATAVALDNRTLADPEVRRSTRSRIWNAQETVEDLHRFIRQFYRATTEEEPALDPGEMRQALRRLLKPATDNTRVVLRLSVSGFQRSLAIPGALLRHLIVPLVRNASEAIATDRARGKKTIAVTVTPLELSSGLRIEVRDRGPGWHGKLPDVRRKILKAERFSTKGRHRGFGLQNVNRIVRKLGGQIILDENPGGGASVEIRLPWEYDRGKADEDERLVGGR